MTKSTRYAKRHYEDTAKILRDAGLINDDGVLLSQLIKKFIELYELDNPRFDVVRFRIACFGGKK